MDNQSLAKAQFDRDTENHQMKVLRDDGLYRHLSFTNNGSSIYQFDLITWPGHLTITGDMGTYTFSRVKDMFQFFESESGAIKPGYWHEKLLGVDRVRGSMEFSRELFKSAVDDCFKDWEFSTEEEKSEVRQELDDMIELADSEEEAQRRASDYESDYGHTMQDFWEHRLKDHNLGYLWALHAIVYGVKEYNLLKASQEAQSEESATIAPR